MKKLAYYSVAAVLIFSVMMAISSYAWDEERGPWNHRICKNNSVPNPTVIGPIPVTVPLGDPSHNYPYLATAIDLARQGYVEEEFFIEGLAHSYNTPSLATGSIMEGDQPHPYKTRIVVRRPISPKHFNGTVILEWYNVTAQYDLEVDWFESNEHFMRSGYAWVGVSAQRVGVNDLRNWSPNRYGTLDVTVGGTINNDSLCYDIYSQAAQAIWSSKEQERSNHHRKSPSREHQDRLGIHLLGGLQAKLIIATGHSQSAGRLVIYHNSIHPLHDVLDGFMIHGSDGALRGDLDVKVMKVLAELDVRSSNPEVDTDHYRRWETAGTSHIGNKEQEDYTPLVIRDRGAVAPRTCTKPPFSMIPFHYVFNAAYDHLVRWVEGEYDHHVRWGEAEPPISPRLEWSSPTTKARDNYGNVLGGIRLSQHEVATGVNTGDNAGPGFCFLFGSHEWFDDATLHALYRNHWDYVSAVNHVTKDNLRAGFILEKDAQETRVEAAHSSIP
jgi:hypothetical protein